jgi:hypothetical protein
MVYIYYKFIEPVDYAPRGPSVVFKHFSRNAEQLSRALAATYDIGVTRKPKLLYPFAPH